MKSNGRGLLTWALMPALGLFLLLPAVTVTAQDGYWDRNNQRRERRQDSRERRRQRREARRDRDQNRDGSYRDDSYRNNGDYRNDGYYGNNGGYRNDGYYGNNGGYYGGGSSQLRQTALNAGYNNGIEEGRKDRQRGDRYDFRDEGDYQKATEDYSSRLGDRELYKRYFRQGFENGYRTGYNGY